MKCPNCKKKIDRDMQYCPVCGTKLVRTKTLIVIPVIFMAFLVLFGAILFVHHANDGDISEREFNDYISYDDRFLEIEVHYMNDEGYVESVDIPSLLDEIKDIAEEGIANGIINNYTRDSNNIYIEFESGISYLFIPLEKGVLSGGEGGKILTVEPAKDSFGVMKESFVTFIDKFFNKLDYTGSFTPIGNAELVKNAFYDLYEFDSLLAEVSSSLPKAPWPDYPEYSLRNDNVTVESMKTWSENKIVIFEGHGAYNSSLHSCLVTGEGFLGFQEFSKYKDDIAHKNIVLTSFPEIPGIGIPYSPVRNYCITSNFIDTYFGEMDESLIFLGACSSAKDDVFAQSLLNKGAAVVMGYSDVTAMEYEMMTRTMFFYGLTKGNDTGGFYTISQALDYAKKCIGSSDPWSGYRSELVCFTNKDNYENQYTLNGLIQGDALIKEADIDFAKNYYNQLASTIGLADDFIETKSITVVDQGAASNCLTPDNAELGIVFKETADFDGNGIDDLIVVTLEDCDGCIKLVETVYFFDEVGNYTCSSSSYSNLFTNNSNYYFYKAGDCIVKIIEEDNSGDWIDGLRYEIIENNVKIHGDHIFIRSYDMNAPDNGNSLGEVLYVHKDFRYPDNVCYTIDDADNYYAIYNRGFILNSSDDKCFAAENEACDYIDSLLSDLLDDKIRKIQPTTWENRWDTGFFPTDEIPESYTKLKISGSPSYKTGDKTTENNIVIDAEYVNSR